jgi:multidrug efflux pump subunit AcrB
MVKFLIHRPVAVTMAFLAFLLIGIATTTNLPVSLMPDIDIPVVSIRISSSELPARQLENTVVKTVRNLLKEVNHVEELKSETRDGSAWIELRFRHGTPIDLASVEVNEKVDKAMNFLPREMKRPEVIRASASDIPVFYLMINQKQLSSPSSTSPLRGDERGAGALLSLSNFSSQVIRKRLEQLPEVALVDMSGLQHPEIKITPNKTFLQNGSFSVAQLEEALQNNNIDLGNLLIRDGQYQYNIRFNTRLRDVSDIENVPVNLNGKVVKLKELAEINLQSQKPQGNVNFNSNPAISLAVIKQSDAKMADLEKELDFLISRFREDYPNLEFSVTRDQSKLLKYSISNLGQSLIIGGLLAFLTMFVFLRERKAPWLIGISIPVSLIISLLLFYLTGLSINIISLSGLILGVGMMIDNSIIVIDNITQHRERNSQIHTSQKTTRTIETIETIETTETLKPSNLKTSSNPQTPEPSSTSSPLDLLSKSCEDGTNEIISPLISSVLTTCAVFIPLIFMKGMAGALFFDQAVAVTIGLTVSLIVSITLLPTLYRLIYRKNSNDKARKKKLPIYFHWYESGLKFVFRHQFLTVFSVLIMLVVLVFMWKWLPVSRFPKMSLDETILKIDWNEPVTLDENNARITELIVGISAKPEYIIEEAGRQQYFLNSIGEAGTSENNLFIKCTSPQKLKELTSDVTGLIQKSYPHADFSFNETENLFNLAFGKSDAPLIARVTHFNPGGENYLTELAELQKELEQKFGEKITSRIITRNLILLETDPEKLLYYQVDNTDLYREIKSAFNVNTVFTINDNNLYVPVSVGNDYASVYEIIQNITIRNKNNERIPLSGLVKISSGSDLKTIVAGRESEYFPVLFEIEPNAYNKTTQEIKTIIGNNQNYDVTFGGSILSNRGMLLELLLIVGVSLLLLYFILAAQFESFVLPLIVLLEVPIDLFGVFLFLKLFGAGINIMSAIGIIVMTGIIINDSILKIDTINKLMEAGNSLIRSIFEAGRRRLKPILMTSLTTILAMAPLMFQKGLGADLQKPMALAIIGGMFIGTLVSLFFIPLMYYLLKRKS